MDTNAFPDIRWGHDRRLLKKPLNAFVSSRIGSWYLRKLTPIDRKLLAHSKGRRTIFGPMGVPLLLLTTTGRKNRAAPDDASHLHAQRGPIISGR